MTDLSVAPVTVKFPHRSRRGILLGLSLPQLVLVSCTLALQLGTDLLDDAPPALVAALTGGEHRPSRTLDHLITPDGSPPVRM
ncbi:hypothetical protein [Streptomyces nodosus]|uniref:Uncharacterized protein n=1 Tax=Streptomyces nodosus TaxID=40318 RepID=A0A5P2WD57_9ACTN|nr:hypothetical protein [Streptomyces nodosus]QEV42267.1 hypothetical protein CP978_30235 [Streptomyces nodosus]